MAAFTFKSPFKPLCLRGVSLTGASVAGGGDRARSPWGLRELKGGGPPEGAGAVTHESSRVAHASLRRSDSSSAPVRWSTSDNQEKTSVHISLSAMGNLPLPISLFRSDATKSDEVVTERFVTKRVCDGIIYYYTPVTAVDFATTCPANDSQAPISCCSSPALPLSDLSSADSSVSPLLSDPSSHPASSPRPLLVFFCWLGAQPGAVAKYRDLYLGRGVDVLLVQSRVTHFLWPRWGLSYGLEVLNILREPPFSGRDILVHSCSIGGYTFTQMLSHIAEEPKLHADVAPRVRGHVYDSLVVGSLEHMAIGLGKTLMPRIEGLIRNLTLLYFRLFKAHTADLYEKSIQVFYNSPVTSPALFFYSDNDAMCSPADLEKLFHFWRRRGVTVASRKWKESTHAAHLRCHPEEYVSTLQHFLNSI